MSRILCAAAIAAIGLCLSTTTRADAPAAASPTATHATTADHATLKAENAVRPWRASETLGIRIENSQGENLGKIEDIVFNPADGHIRYAVLSFGGFLGVGEKYFAVPWKHLRAEAKSSTAGNEKFVLVLDVDKTRLKSAPGFDSKHWPDFGNPAYGTSVDGFYGDNATASRPKTNAK